MAARQDSLLYNNRPQPEPGVWQWDRNSRGNKNGYNSVIMNVASPRQNAGTGSKKKKRKRRRHDHVFTLGIEEEFQIIDPETRELRSHIQQILADSKMVLQERVKPELHQSIAELGTEICSDARDARQQVVKLRTELAKLAAQHGLKIASAGTHPFSHWMDQLITVHERYASIVKDMQQIARVMPHIWSARTCGYSRSRGGDRHHEPGALFPSASLRALCEFTILAWPKHRAESVSPYDLRAFSAHGNSRRIRESERLRRLSELLVSTNCIDNAKKIWWDVRLHPFFDTIEFRICDAQSRVDDTIALAALMQAIVVKLQKLRRDNVTFRSYPQRLIDENRWRASRYGLDGKLIDFGRKCEVDERDLLNEMLEFIATEVDELGNQRRDGTHRTDHARRNRRRPPTRRLGTHARHESGSRPDRRRDE